MPPGRWYIQTIAQTDLHDGFLIQITTDTPCHLWLLWTSHDPWVHRKAALERGLTWLFDAYWCMVAWEMIEQAEGGDTLSHTFSWPGWVVCQTKWFRFKGQVGGVDSPSDSPIFSKHFTYEAPPTVEEIMALVVRQQAQWRLLLAWKPKARITKLEVR